MHSLNFIPKNRHVELEVHRGIVEWDYMVLKLKSTCSFVAKDDAFNRALKVLKGNIFSLEC